ERHRSSSRCRHPSTSSRHRAHPWGSRWHALCCRRTGRNTRMKKRIAITLIAAIVVLGMLAGGLAILWSSYGDALMKRFGFADLDYPGPGSGEAVVTIYEGEIGSDVARTLAEEDIVKTSEAFYDLLLSRPDVVLNPGTYSLKLHMSAEG